MAFSDKNTILNVIMMICIFNFVLLLGIPMFLLEHFTGDVVSSGTINSGEVFQDSPMFIKNKDVTFIFGTRVNGMEVKRELLNITLTTPDDIELSWKKGFECKNTDKDKPILGTDCSDPTMIFTPKSTGIYHIKISDAKFNTKIEIISGMVNPLKKNPLVYIGAIAFSFIVVMFISIIFHHDLTPIFADRLTAIIKCI